MNQIMNNKIINFTFYILLLVLIAKIISLIFFYYLPKQGIDFKIVSTQNKNSQIAINPFKNIQIKEQNIKKSSESTLSLNSLKLIAIYKENNGGFAIISEGVQTSVIKFGENYKNYKLIQIDDESIVLSQNDKKYKLEFSKEKFNSSEQIQQPQEPLVQNAEQTNNQNITQNLSFKIQKDEFSLNVKDIENAKKNITFKEISKNGAVDGFRILSLNRNSFFGKLGLQPSDIIKTINNIPINNYEKILEMYSNIDSYDNIKIEIIRNNTAREINYEIF